MSIFDRFKAKSNNGNSVLQQELAIAESNLSLFQERLAELELHLEDEGWQLMAGGADKEFSRSGLRTINQLARLYFLKNPLIRRAVLTQTQYVFGQGMNIQAKHYLVDEMVQSFLVDEKNRSELTEHQAMMVKETELQLFSNLFFVFFTNKFTGRVRVRTIPVDEIEDIICNPEDSKDVWFYKRVWTRSSTDLSNPSYGSINTAYYPDWRYTPKTMPETIGSSPVMVDNPIYHVSVNRLSDMKFGVSEIYAGIDWAKAYKDFLENWATIVKAYSRFAWKQTLAKGGAAAVAAAKTKLASTMATGNETNPPPVTGSTFISTEGVKMEPIRTAGATTSADDGRHLRLMVSSATGIFEHYLTGDPSTGNLATAKAMEMPMLIMFRDRQQLWTSIWTEILNFVIKQAVRAGKLPGVVEIDEEGDEVVVLADDVDNENAELREQPIDATLDISFPNILEQDIVSRVNAVVSAATLNGQMMAGTMELKLVARLLLEALGLDDVDAIIMSMFPEEHANESTEQMMVKAVRKLAEALDRGV